MYANRWGGGATVLNIYGTLTGNEISQDSLIVLLFLACMCVYIPCPVWKCFHIVRQVAFSMT